MKVQHIAYIAALKGFLIVSVAQESEHHPAYAEGRLDHIRNIPGVILLIKIGLILAGGGLVRRQVKVCAGGNAPKLAPLGKGEGVFKIGRGIGIVAQFFLLMIPEPQVFLMNAQVEQPLMAEVLPIREPFKLGTRFAEEFQLHLLKFARAENEVARCNFIAERFADLRNAERQLLARAALNVLEVYKDALRGFGTEINGVFCVFRHALEGLEHQVKLANVGKVVLAAGRAGDRIFVDISFHFLWGESIHGLGQGNVFFLRPSFNDFVSTEAFFAFLAVHKRIGKPANVAGSNPYLRVHQNSRIKADIIGAFLNKLFPPGLFYVVFQLYA